MNVLFITQSVDSFRPGPDGFIIDWIEALSRHVDKLIVLTYHYNPKEILPSNTSIFLINGKNVLSRNFDLISKITRILLSNKVDILFPHMLEVFGIAAGIAGRIFHKKTFFWYCMWYDLRRNTQAKLALLLPDKILTCSSELKTIYPQQVGNWIKNKIIVVGIGIKISRFNDDKNIIFPRQRKVRIAYSGRISPIKDVTTMLSAIERLAVKGKDIGFDLIGSWGVLNDKNVVFKNTILQEIERINTKFSKEIITYKKPESYIYSDSPRLFHSADIFIMPGLKTFLEIVSCGTVAIIPELYVEKLRNEFPEFVYKLGNCDDLADKINFLADNPKLTSKRIKQLQNYVALNYDINDLMDRITKEFRC